MHGKYKIWEIFSNNFKNRASGALLQGFENEIKSSILSSGEILGKDRFSAGPPKKPIFSMQIVFFTFDRKSLETTYV